jgi:hypothetical protein
MKRRCNGNDHVIGNNGSADVNENVNAHGRSNGNGKKAKNPASAAQCAWTTKISKYTGMARASASETCDCVQI